ncbi:hypothetical protein J7S33_28605, partial [Saccharothrix algeriensis]
MNSGEDSAPVFPNGGIHQEGRASHGGTVNQAGRDLNFYHGDGVNTRRRTVPHHVVDECPYPGLASFEPEQAKWFFGRDGLVTELNARLDLRLREGGIQVVVA